MNAIRRYEIEFDGDALVERWYCPTRRARVAYIAVEVLRALGRLIAR